MEAADFDDSRLAQVTIDLDDGQLALVARHLFSVPPTDYRVSRLWK